MVETVSPVAPVGLGVVTLTVLPSQSCSVVMKRGEFAKSPTSFVVMILPEEPDTDEMS